MHSRVFIGFVAIGGFFGTAIALPYPPNAIAAIPASAIRIAPTPHAAKPMAPTQMIAEEMLSNDPAKRKEGLDAITQSLQGMHPDIGLIHREVIPVLMKARKYQQVATLARRCMLMCPDDTVSVQNLLEDRIAALLKLGQADEALAESKSLFNETTFGGTPKAIQLVAESLAAAHPNDPGMAARFKLQQIAGATWHAPSATAATPAAILAEKPATTQPATPAATTQTTLVLQTITVDAKAYEADIKQLKDGEGFPYLHTADFTKSQNHQLLAMGNLLLLADRPRDAQKIFEMLYQNITADRVFKSSDPLLIRTTLNLARCIRAEDGAIGRANAWIKALHPPAR